MNALTGKGAILVTTNAYLAVRDGEEMGKVYQFLGLTVGIGAKEEEDTDTNQDSEEDRKVSIWQILPIQLVQHLVLIISNNLASSAEGKFLRDFNYVIVDEADAVLLDSAQTPLIISGFPRVQSNLFDICNQFILTLKEGEEFF